MKKIPILLVAIFICSCASMQQHNALLSLAETTGWARDEIYNFKVTYSNVRIDKGNLCFDLRMAHNEHMGSYTITGHCKFPIATLKEAKREVEITELMHNSTVNIKIIKGSKPLEIAGEVETRDKSNHLIGSKKSFKKLENQFSFFFSTQQEAKKWNNELSDFLKSN